MALFDGAAQGGGLLEGLQKTAENFSITPAPNPLEGVDMQDPASLDAAAANAIKTGDFEAAKKYTTSANAARGQQEKKLQEERRKKTEADKIQAGIEEDNTIDLMASELEKLDPPQAGLANRLRAGILQPNDPTILAFMRNADLKKAQDEDTAKTLKHKDVQRGAFTSALAQTARDLEEAGEDTAALQVVREKMANTPGLDPVIAAQFLDPRIGMNLSDIRALYKAGLAGSEEVKKEQEAMGVIMDGSRGYVSAMPSAVMREKYGPILEEGLKGQTPAYAGAFFKMQQVNYEAEVAGGDPLWVSTTTPNDRKFSREFVEGITDTSETGTPEGGFSAFANTVSGGYFGTPETPADFAYSESVIQLMADTIGSYQAARGVPNGLAQREASEMFMEVFNRKAAELKKDGKEPQPTVLAMQIEMTEELQSLTKEVY
jgi:hypothetical protein